MRNGALRYGCIFLYVSYENVIRIIMYLIISYNFSSGQSRYIGTTIIAALETFMKLS